MTFKEAQKLHNRDEVKVRSPNGIYWEWGYVLGEPREVDGRIILPVQTPESGFREVDHTDVR